MLIVLKTIVPNPNADKQSPVIKLFFSGNHSHAQTMAGYYESPMPTAISTPYERVRLMLSAARAESRADMTIHENPMVRMSLTSITLKRQVPTTRNGEDTHRLSGMMKFAT